MIDLYSGTLPFETNMTNAVYAPHAWTNISGMHLPVRFQVLRYPEMGNADRYRLYIGKALSIDPLCAAIDFFPNDTGMATDVNDTRLANDTKPADVSYLSRSGAIITNVDELKRTDAYAKAVRRTQLDKIVTTQKPKGSRSLVLVLGGVSLLSLVWILKRPFDVNKHNINNDTKKG